MAETVKRTGVVDPEKVRQPRGSVDPDRLAEVGETWEREIGSDPRDPIFLAEDVARAEVDTLVPLSNVPTSKGSSSAVFVAAGDRLPSRAAVGETSIPAEASPAYRGDADPAVGE